MDILDVDLSTIIAFKQYLNQELTGDRMLALNPTPEEEKKADRFETLVILMMENLKVSNHERYRNRVETYKLWEMQQVPITRLLSVHKSAFLEDLPAFEEYYIDEVKKMLFDSRISNMTGREFNVYLQVTMPKIFAS